jgi:hypothetical protein
VFRDLTPTGYLGAASVAVQYCTHSEQGSELKTF